MSIKKCVNGSFVNDFYKEYGTDTDTITSLPKTIIGDGQPISSYTIKGNMVQSGTPTPSNPVYPQETGDKTANLSLVTQENSVYYNNNFKNYTVANNIVSTTGNAYFGFIVKVEPETTYSIQADADDLGIRMQVMEFSAKPTDFSTNLIGTAYNKYMSISKTGDFTTTSTTQYVLFGFYADKVDRIFNIMMNEGSTPSATYEPYGYKIPISFDSNTYTFYLSEPIRKIGDSVDTAQSIGTASRAIKKLVLTGQESFWSDDGTVDTRSRYRILPTGADTVLRGNRYDLYCTHFKTDLQVSANSVLIYNGTTGVFIYFYVLTADYPTLADFKTYIQQQYAAGTPVTLYYILATPTTETFTAPTIPTSGSPQSFDVSTTLKPSEVSLTWHGWHEHSDTKYSNP